VCRGQLAGSPPRSCPWCTRSGSSSASQPFQSEGSVPVARQCCLVRHTVRRGCLLSAPEAAPLCKTAQRPG
jgi:hypothetical protein